MLFRPSIPLVVRPRSVSSNKAKPGKSVAELRDIQENRVSFVEIETDEIPAKNPVGERSLSRCGYPNNRDADGFDHVLRIESVQVTIDSMVSIFGWIRPCLSL